MHACAMQLTEPNPNPNPNPNLKDARFRHAVDRGAIGLGVASSGMVVASSGIVVASSVVAADPRLT